MSTPFPTHVVLVGAGNIGSQAAPLAARLSGLTRLTIVDHDRYEAANVASQAISVDDVGQSKAIVLAVRLRNQAPALRVEPIVARIEDVPLGLLRGAVVLGALDSRAARRSLALCSWRVRAPLIDAGVNPDAELVRVSTFMPGENSAPCYTCDWSNEDYAQLGNMHRCDGTAAAPASTRAPAFLGALAAALQVAECEHLLAGEVPDAGTDVVLDARGKQHFLTGRRRNPGCRFDHEVLGPVEPFDRAPHDVTLGGFFDAAGGEALRVEPFTFFTEAVCCNARVSTFCVKRSTLMPQCPECGQPMSAVGFSALEWLELDRLTQAQLNQTLGSIGLIPLDIVRIRHSSGTERVLELPEL